MSKTNCKEVVWLANAILNCAVVITRSFGLSVLATSTNLPFSNEQY